MPARVAVLIDLGYFMPQYRALIERRSSPPHTPKHVAHQLWRTAVSHVRKCDGEQLYRIFVLLKREITAAQLTESDVVYDTVQKGVDMKLGIDIALSCL